MIRHIALRYTDIFLINLHIMINIIMHDDNYYLR